MLRGPRPKLVRPGLLGGRAGGQPASQTPAPPASPRLATPPAHRPEACPAPPPAPPCCSRFLQGPDTDQGQLQILRQALTASPPRAATVTLLNYRKTGEPFWNCLHVAPIRDAGGRVQFFIGVQMDVSSKANAAQAAEPTPVQLLNQKGTVGAVRVATRGLAATGLRRDADCRQMQGPPGPAV